MHVIAQVYQCNQDTLGVTKGNVSLLLINLLLYEANYLIINISKINISITWLFILLYIYS